MIYLVPVVYVRICVCMCLHHLQVLCIIYKYFEAMLPGTGTFRIVLTFW